jgi:asparagine synthase (glutamine-hydrolysing)
LAFASEAKALFTLPEVSRRIEPQSIAAYLDLAYVPEQLRLFAEIERLQAGCWLAVHGRTVTRGRYAGVAAPAVPASIGFGEACDRVEAAVREAVRLRLRADVPLGVFLSGGVDSSLVALQAARLVPGRLRTYTVGFKGEADERPFARQVAQAVGAEHTEVEVELDAPALAGEVARHWDEPFGDSSAVPMLAMARETQKAVKVVLSGDGGDEIFGGYGLYLRHLRKSPAGATGLLGRWAGRGVRWAQAGARRLPARLSAVAAAVYRPLRHRFDGVGDAAVADPALRHLLSARVSHARRPEELLSPLLGGSAFDPASLLVGAPRGLPAVRTAMRIDRLVYLPGDILKKVDVAAMRFGLEVRSPFLDDDLIALADQLPEGFLASRLEGQAEERWGKRPLKALVARALGEPFAYRAKQGFGAPLQTWLADPRFLQQAEDGFASAGTPLRGWFAPGSLAQVLREFRGGKGWLAQEVWNLIILDAWAREVRPT